MQKRIDSVKAGHLRPVLQAGLAGVLLASAMLAQAVTPPPLPAGSNLVKVEPGLDKQEQKREDRAHRNKMKKKNIDVDDSQPGNNGNGNGNGNGKGKDK